MANTRVLVKRRKAVRNIRKITRTMELIATARFKKAFDRAVEADAFTRKIAELAADLSSTRGLCGGYNTAVIREAMNRIRQVRAEGATLKLELSGKRAITYFRFQGI